MCAQLHGYKLRQLYTEATNGSFENCSVSMKPIQLPLGVRLRDDATFINYYPGANAAALGYVERLCEADAGWTESLIYLWAKRRRRTHLLQAACLRFEQMWSRGVSAAGRVDGSRHRISTT